MPILFQIITSNSQFLQSNRERAVTYEESHLTVAVISSPPCPEEMDWSKHYPEHFTPEASGSGSVSTTGKKVEWVDIGCGFGGLTCALAPLFPNELILGEACRLIGRPGNANCYCYEQVWRSA